jgi:sugar phosphate isomerase/epimerase
MAGLRIGCQSAFSAVPLTAPFDFALANGFDSFEWFPDKRPDGAGWLASDLDLPFRQAIRARARDAGMRLSVHAPVWADPLVPRTHPDLESSLRLAVDLGASLLNIHMTDPSRPAEFASAVLPLAQRCSISGVKLAIENTPAASPEDFNRLFALLPRGSAGMCLDIGHANLHSTTHNDYIGFLDRLAPEARILHVHLHENHGDRDSHLVLFTGPSARSDEGPRALVRRLIQRGFEGSLILEQWPSPPTLLTTARDRLASLISEEEAR